MLHMVRLFLASLSLSFLVVSLASGPVMAAEKGRAPQAGGQGRCGQRQGRAGLELRHVP